MIDLLPSIVVLGIDPGFSGGLAWVSRDETHAQRMPLTDRDIWELFLAPPIGGAGGPDFCFLEKVASMPKQGVVSTFKFGMNYGMIRGFLVAADIPFETVTPGKWQRSMDCLSGGNKNVTKKKAQELFPTIKMTHALADCLLIAEYGRRELARRGV